MKRTVADLMKQRNLSQIPILQETASLEEALTFLFESDIGAVLVMRGEAIIGVFSERDFARAFKQSDYKISKNTAVSVLMSEKVIYVTTDYRLDECLAVMVKMKIRHLPVMQDDRPVAFLSMRHIMEALVEDNQFVVNQLVTYITGTSVIEKNEIRSALTKEFKSEVREPNMAMSN